MNFFLNFCFVVLCCTGFSISKAAESIFPLTRTKIQNLLKNPPANQKKLKEEVIYGCISVPAKDFFQRIFVGSISTKEPCSIVIHPGNKVSVSFLNQKNIPLVSTSRPHALTDTFTAELDNGQVLIVQQVGGRVVSLTQTVYDSQGTVVYQNSGEGDYIRECHFYMPGNREKPTAKPC